MSDVAVETDEHTEDVLSARYDKHILSLKLLAPSAVLSMLVFGLTFLPMASCTTDRQIVPARLAVEVTQESMSNNEGSWRYLAGIVDSIPVVFMFTLPYWTAFPVLLILPMIWKSCRWATRTWRFLVLALALACSSFALMDQDDWRWNYFHYVCFSAVGMWLWSSPVFAWIAGLGYQLIRRGRKPSWNERQPLFGGFWSLALLCFAGYFYLALFEGLLYGGKLAAIANVILGFALVVSARQSRIDPRRLPQFNMQDVMIVTLAIAIALWRFWVVEDVSS